MPLSKEFYLDQIKSKYPNSYNKSLEDLPVKDLEDMLDFLDEALDKADGGSIGIEVLFTEKKKNGGRIGFDNGGQTAPAGTFTLTDYVNFLNTAGDFNRLFDKGEKLVGEAGEFVEQIGDKEYDDYTGKELIRERELEGQLENLEDEFAKTEDDYYDRARDIPADEEAMGAYARQLINDLNQRNVTLDTLAEIAGLKKGGRVGLFMGGPPLEGQALAIYNSMNVGGATDQAIADRLQSLGLYTPPDSGAEPPTTIQPIGFQGGGGDGRVTELQETFTKDLSQDPRFDYLTPQEQANKYRFDRSVEPREGLIGLYDKTKNFFAENRFFQPKIRGTLGDRLLAQSQGITSKIPLPGAMLGYLRSPFNPDSPTYNPNLPGQLNFLEAGTGTKITGTSDNLKFTEGLALIGRDPGTGGLKYGPGSVLAGKNVISGFGSNDYETALNKYLTRMNTYTNPTKFQLEKIKQAEAELKALQEKQAQDMREREASTAARARAANPDVYARADALGFTDGRGGGFASKSTGTNENFSNRTGRGRTGYSEGGLATMFKRKR